VLGHQIGGGRGNTVATTAGAAGGAYAAQGRRNKKTKSYRTVTLKMDAGSTRTFTASNQPTVREGDRVKLIDGGKRPAPAKTHDRAQAKTPSIPVYFARSVHSSSFAHRRHRRLWQDDMGSVSSAFLLPLAASLSAAARGTCPRATCRWAVRTATARPARPTKAGLT
jgi:hypothetical protein